MFKTNIKIAWRNLLKDKQFTLLNVLGLSAGLACALLIFLWVNDERNVDKFFSRNDQVYQLMEKRNYSGEQGVSEESSGNLSEAVRLAAPEVEYAAAVAPSGWFTPFALSADRKSIRATGQYADRDYFNIFSFHFLEGKPGDALSGKTNIVISDILAKKLFGTTENIIGRPIRIGQEETFFVSGIFQQPSKSSSQQFDFVLSFDYFRDIKSWVKSWYNLGPLNYALLKKGANVAALNKRIEGVVAANCNDTTRKIFATKFSDLYLHNNYGNNSNNTARFVYVRMFSILAFFVVVIACINFMNLSTARAARRLKEVGVKKVVGAGRAQLVWQFLSESMFITLISAMIALFLVYALLPAFNQITGKSVERIMNRQIAAGFITIVLLTGVLAGSYPALYLSRFNPLAILKGELRTSVAEMISRKGLVVFQFTISSLLIVAVTVIYQQLRFMQHTDPGFQKDNIVRIAAEGNIFRNEASFIAQLKTIPGVVNASSTAHNLVGHNFSMNGMQWPGMDPNESVLFEGFGVDYGFLETMHMHLLSGRSFSKEFGADSTSLIINEAAARAMHMKDPVGKTVKMYGKNIQIIGLVRDFHFESMHEAIKPAYFSLGQQNGTIVASIRSGKQSETLASIERLYRSFNPGFPFTYNFLDEAYQRQYQSEQRASALFEYFAGLAILISCLGLFGLAAFTAQKRKKEIGIRKVVGASVANVAVMLSNDFLKLIGLSLLIAFPISAWLMNGWLQGFAYRIHLNPLIFLACGLTIIAITVVTVSFQSIRAALANPVKSLRTE